MSPALRTRADIEATIEALIVMLDLSEPDPDFEPEADEDACDDEGAAQYTLE